MPLVLQRVGRTVNTNPMKIGADQQNLMLIVLSFVTKLSYSVSHTIANQMISRSSTDWGVFLVERE